MNQLDNLRVNNHLEATSLMASTTHITNGLYLGNTHFSAQQLAELLIYLLAQHPEINL